MKFQVEVIITSKEGKERIMLEPKEDYEYYKFLAVWIYDFTRKMSPGNRLSFQVHPYSPNLPFL